MGAEKKKKKERELKRERSGEIERKGQKEEREIKGREGKEKEENVSFGKRERNRENIQIQNFSSFVPSFYSPVSTFRSSVTERLLLSFSSHYLVNSFPHLFLIFLPLTFFISSFFSFRRNKETEKEKREEKERERE